MRYLRKRNEALVALSLLAALMLSSCSGSGSGNSSGTISGVGLSALVVADRVSVVDPKGGGAPVAPTGIKALLVGLIPSQLPAASDYFADKTTVYVNERSVEAFNTVNNILCMLKQTAYDAMVNKGPYMALIDENACNSARSDASSGGQSTQDQSSSSAITQYVTWTVDSSRLSEDSPHIVRIWFHEGVPGIMELTILIRVVITESVSVAPPYGIFKINYKVVDSQNPLNIWFKGFLDAERDPVTSKILLKYATEQESTDYTQIEKATLDKSPDGTGGSGSVLKVEASRGSTPKTDRFDIAYNSDLFLRSNFDNTKTCLDRKTVDVSAWRYGLYDKVTGNRRNLNTGFTIKTQDGQYGWIGYWGYWLPTGVTLNNNDIVYQHDYNTGNDTPYTVFKVYGKLKKHTKHSITLNDIKNIPMDWWDSAAQKNTRMIWTGAEFQKVAELTTGTTGSYWASLTPTPFSLSGLSQTELYFWSQSIGGSVRVKLTGCTYNVTSFKYDCVAQVGTTADQVVYYTEDIVYPNDGTFPVPPTLACFWNCPDAANLSTATPFKAISTSTNTIYKEPSKLVPNVDYTTYTFNTTSNVLLDGVTAAEVTTTTLDPAYQWGIRSGELFEPTPANMDALKCSWDLTGLSTCGWQAGSALPVFYTWETGKDSWNQFIALRDAGGTIVRFEKPLQVTYLHIQPDTTALDYKYNNVKFFLEYGGFGDLRGIPSFCINLDDGTTANCADSATNSSIRWVPEFTIPDKDPLGSGNLTEVTDEQSGISYIVKALEKEERMRGIPDTAQCTNVLTASPYSLPDMSSWDDPNIGREPAVTSAPKVIGGVVQ